MSQPIQSAPIGDGLELHFWDESLMTISHDREHRRGAPDHLIAFKGTMLLEALKARLAFERSRHERQARRAA
jgi:hypothetical protein